MRARMVGSKGMPKGTVVDLAAFRKRREDTARNEAPKPPLVARTHDIPPVVELRSTASRPTILPPIPAPPSTMDVPPLGPIELSDTRSIVLRYYQPFIDPRDGRSKHKFCIVPAPLDLARQHEYLKRFWRRGWNAVERLESEKKPEQKQIARVRTLTGQPYRMLAYALSPAPDCPIKKSDSALQEGYDVSDVDPLTMPVLLDL